MRDRRNAHSSCLPHNSSSSRSSTRVDPGLACLACLARESTLAIDHWAVASQRASGAGEKSTHHQPRSLGRSRGSSYSYSSRWSSRDTCVARPVASRKRSPTHTANTTTISSSTPPRVRKQVKGDPSCDLCELVSHPCHHSPSSDPVDLTYHRVTLREELPCMANKEINLPCVSTSPHLNYCTVQ